MISRMQRQDYIERLKEAAQVLEQPPGAPTGDVLGETARAISTC